MTTLAARRTELSGALTTAGIRYSVTWTGEPPYVAVFFDGTDFDPLVNGQTPVRFAVVAVISKALDDVSLAAVDAIVEDIYAVLLDLSGWQIASIDGLTRSQVGTDTMYTVTFRTSAMTELGG